MDRWLEMELFVAAAETGSLTRAAGNLGISVSSTSRHLRSLEERLGVRLIQRTTRHFHLTSEGEQFLARSRELVSSLKDAEASVSADVVDPKGLLRVTASVAFCVLHLEPVVRDFITTYPGVTIDVMASNRYYDLIENGVDLAIRTRRVEADSSITVRRLAETKRLLTASPAYLDAYGTPARPDALCEHRLLLYTLSDNWNTFTFTRGQESLSLSVKGVLNCNEHQILRRAALDGLGISVQPAYIVHDDLQAGRLVRVLDGWELPRLTMNIAFPSRLHMPAKTRLFIDFLLERFRREDYEAKWTR